MKTFGIYLAYPPEVDLHAQGLGRYLAEFLNAARDRTDARFVIACPSWMIKSLHELFERAGISPKAFEIISPKTEPSILRLFQAYQSYKRRLRKRYFLRSVAYLAGLIGRLTTRAEKALATVRSGLFLSLLILLTAPFLGTVYVLYFLFHQLERLRLLRSDGRLAMIDEQPQQIEHARHPGDDGDHVQRRLPVSLVFLAGLRRIWRSANGWLEKLASRPTLRPQSNPATVRLYRFMEYAEGKLLCDLINSRKEISAWYAPTAFWSHFNGIKAPRLICVPDVVLSEFPVAFSSISGDRIPETFKSIERTIEGGDHFVTYSDDIKYRTLVDHYRVAPDAITVVAHGVNRMDDLIAVSGFPDNKTTTDLFCKSLFCVALNKAIGTENAANFDSGDVQFIFYASQFRPSKNIVSLLRAYEHLLRRRYIGHKLVLTGDPNSLPQIGKFIKEYNLQNDVLCLHGLSAQELAACYRLADLAVNPSLSEGGCPFTLTEALSVGTPVVMARIAVTLEVLTDSDLQNLMLFDPYDWKDIAARIEWALKNRDVLLGRQLELYEKLSERSWATVVSEYIAILDRISSSGRELKGSP